jgi:hypothetical protein
LKRLTLQHNEMTSSLPVAPVTRDADHLTTLSSEILTQIASYLLPPRAPISVHTTLGVSALASRYKAVSHPSVAPACRTLWTRDLSIAKRHHLIKLSLTCRRLHATVQAVAHTFLHKHSALYGFQLLREQEGKRDCLSILLDWLDSYCAFCGLLLRQVPLAPGVMVANGFLCCEECQPKHWGVTIPMQEALECCDLHEGMLVPPPGGTPTVRPVRKLIDLDTSRGFWNMWIPRDDLRGMAQAVHGPRWKEHLTKKLCERLEAAGFDAQAYVDFLDSSTGAALFTSLNTNAWGERLQDRMRREMTHGLGPLVHLAEPATRLVLVKAGAPVFQIITGIRFQDLARKLAREESSEK